MIPPPEKKANGNRTRVSFLAGFYCALHSYTTFVGPHRNEML